MLQHFIKSLRNPSSLTISFLVLEQTVSWSVKILINCWDMFISNVVWFNKSISFNSTLPSPCSTMLSEVSAILNAVKRTLFLTHAHSPTQWKSAPLMQNWAPHSTGWTHQLVSLLDFPVGCCIQLSRYQLALFSSTWRLLPGRHYISCQSTSRNDSDVNPQEKYLQRWRLRLLFPSVSSVYWVTRFVRNQCKKYYIYEFLNAAKLSVCSFF